MYATSLCPPSAATCRASRCAARNLDRLLAVLDHGDHVVVRSALQPFLIDHESKFHRIKKAGRLLDEVFVVASYGYGITTR